MNQILLTNNQNNKKKNNNQYNGNNSGDMKKIIIFFGIAILVFALLIIGVYAYKLSKNNEEETKHVEGPVLSLEETENEVKIVIKAEAGISKVIYSWNDEQDNEFEINGGKDYEEALEIPEGQNTLNVKVIDQNGEEKETIKEFYKEENKEVPKLEIDEEVLRTTGKVKIIASDENNGLKYITYQWNDEEETKIDAESEDQATIETTIDVKRGQNTLRIKAVNNLDKEKDLEKMLKGVNDPVIEVTKDDSLGEMYMKITHDMGFKKIEFTVNGREYIYDENFSGYDSEKKEIEYKFALKEGENIVIIHAISLEDSEKTYKGKCNYTAE